MGYKLTLLDNLQAAELDGPPSIPEKNLLVAILERALLDCSRTNTTRQRRKLRAYFTSICEQPFTFKWICTILEVPQSPVRNLALKLLQKQRLSALNSRGKLGTQQEQRTDASQEVDEPRFRPLRAFF